MRAGVAITLSMATLALRGLTLPIQGFPYALQHHLVRARIAIGSRGVRVPHHLADKPKRKASCREIAAERMPQVMDAEAPRDAGEALRDFEVPLHRGLAVGQTAVSDEDRIVGADLAALECMLQRNPAIIGDRNYDLPPGLPLHEPNPSLLELDVPASKPSKVARPDACFEGNDEEILRRLEADEVRVRRVAVVAHAGAVRAPRSEAAVLRLRWLRLRHRLGDETTEAHLVVEGRQEPCSLVSVQLEARLVRLLFLELLLERQVSDHVELHGVAEKERGEVHVVVHGRAGVAGAFEASAKAVQDTGSDFVQAKSAELRQEVPVDCVTVIARSFLGEVRRDRGEIVGDELAEGRRFGRWTAESFRSTTPELGPKADRFVIRCGVHGRALSVAAGRAGQVHREVRDACRVVVGEADKAIAMPHALHSPRRAGAARRRLAAFLRSIARRTSSRS